MKTEAVEIYSDETNRAVMRHPGRQYPGVLIQGDNLHALCQSADRACASAKSVDQAVFQEINQLRNALWAYLNHYQQTLTAHALPLPYSRRD